MLSAVPRADWPPAGGPGRGRAWQRWLIRLGLAICLAGMTRYEVRSAGDAPAWTAEAEALMATFLLHYVRLATWPEAVTPDPHAPKPPLVIGVVGADPFGRRLDEAFRGETFSGRSAVVRRLTADDDLTGCQLLFISRSEAKRMPDLLTTLRGRPVLTVSDAPGFLAAGGLIAFREERGKLVFDIDAEGAKRANIVLSSRLLRLARNLQKEPAEAR